MRARAKNKKVNLILLSYLTLLEIREEGIRNINDNKAVKSRKRFKRRKIKKETKPFLSHVKSRKPVKFTADRGANHLATHPFPFKIHFIQRSNSRLKSQKQKPNSWTRKCTKVTDLIRNLFLTCERISKLQKPFKTQFYISPICVTHRASGKA